MAGQPQSYGSIREFLDNLPNQPCIWQPENANICVTCLRINEPVARVCSVWAQALEEAPLEEIDFEEEVRSLPSVVEVEDEFEMVESVPPQAFGATVAEVDIVQTSTDWNMPMEPVAVEETEAVVAEPVAVEETEAVIEASTDATEEIVEEAITEPVAVEETEAVVAEPVAVEETEAVVTETVIEASTDATEEIVEEAITEPVAVEEAITEPVAVEEAITEPVAVEEAITEPVAVEETEAVIEASTDATEEIVEEAVAEPVAVEETEAVVAEPVAVEETEAVIAEPVAIEETEAVVAEPVAVEETEEVALDTIQDAVEAENIAKENVESASKVEEITAEAVVEAVTTEAEAVEAYAEAVKDEEQAAEAVEGAVEAENVATEAVVDAAEQVMELVESDAKESEVQEAVAELKESVEKQEGAEEILAEAVITEEAAAEDVESASVKEEESASELEKAILAEEEATKKLNEAITKEEKAEEEVKETIEVAKEIEDKQDDKHDETGEPFSIDEEVSHGVYGDGKVINLNKAGKHWSVEVNFSEGKRRILGTFLTTKKIQSVKETNEESFKRPDSKDIEEKPAPTLEASEAKEEEIATIVADVVEADHGEYEPGVNVVHDIFGTGKITDSKPKGENYRLEIEFEDGTNRNLLSTFVKLSNEAIEAEATVAEPIDTTEEVAETVVNEPEVLDTDIVYKRPEKKKEPIIDLSKPEVQDAEMVDDKD